MSTTTGPRPIVSDEDAFSLLPKSGFIRDYVHYASTLTDAAIVNHIGAAFAILSMTIPPSVYLYRNGGKLHANLYVLLIGNSAIDRKGTTMGIAGDVMNLAFPEKRGEAPSSYEGLLDGMQEKQQQIVFEPEFSRFLSQSKGTGYLYPLKMGLIDIYDARAIDRRTMKGTWKVPQPRLSLFAACDPTLLERNVDPDDFTGGFYSRFMIIWGPRTRYLSDAPPNEAEQIRLAEHLKRIVLYAPAEARVEYSPEAQEILYPWRADIDQFSRSRGRELAGLANRTAELMNKISLMLCIDDYVSSLPPDAPPPDPFAPIKPVLQVSGEQARTAIAIAEASFRCGKSVFDSLARTTDLRDRRSVVEAITARGGRAIMGEIIRDTGIQKRKLQPIVESLCEEGTIEAASIEATDGKFRSGFALSVPPEQRTPSAVAAKKAAEAPVHLNMTTPEPPPAAALDFSIPSLVPTPSILAGGSWITPDDTYED